jgi:hypothetical protein
MAAYLPVELNLKTGHDSVSNSRAQFRLYVSLNWEKNKNKRINVIFALF